MWLGTILFMICVLIIITFAECLIGDIQSGCGGPPWLYWLPNCFVMGGLIVWIFIGLCTPTQYERCDNVTPVNVNGAQVVSYEWGGELKIINVNKKFGRSFEDGEQVQIEYPETVYAGVDFVAIMKPKIGPVAQ